MVGTIICFLAGTIISFGVRTFPLIVTILFELNSKSFFGLDSGECSTLLFSLSSSLSFSLSFSRTTWPWVMGPTALLKSISLTAFEFSELNFIESVKSSSWRTSPSTFKLNLSKVFGSCPKTTSNGVFLVD